MSGSHFTGELTPSPTALECRKRLTGLKPSRERRKGKLFIGLLRVISTFTLPIFFILFGIIDGSWLPREYEMPVAMIIFSSSIMLCLYFVAREQRLYNRNCIEQLDNHLKPKLNNGEHVLSLCVGRASSIDTPDWLGDVSPYSYFLFTTDRLLIINFDPELSGTNLINKEIEKQTIEKYIKSIITCSLTEESNCKFGGFIAIELLFNLLYTKVEIRPVNEHHSYTWLIDDKFTQSGKLLREIRNRISNITTVVA